MMSVHNTTKHPTYETSRPPYRRSHDYQQDTSSNQQISPRREKSPLVQDYVFTNMPPRVIIHGY